MDQIERLMRVASGEELAMSSSQTLQVGQAAHIRIQSA